MKLFNAYQKSVSNLLDGSSRGKSVFKDSKGEQLYRQAYEATLQQWPVPYESVFVPTRFGQTHLIVSGSPRGQPIVLLHGVLASATMWFPQLEALHTTCRTYAIDILGDVNLSTPTHLPGNRQETSEWLLEVFAQLDIQRTMLMGISLGGFLALNLALHVPQRVSRMVILDPAATLAPYSLSFMLRTIPTALAAIFSEHPMSSLLRWTTASGQVIAQAQPLLRQMDLALKWGRMQIRSFPTVLRDGELRRLAMPILLMMGAKAVMYNPQVATKRAQSLIPNVKVEIVSETGHLLTLEKPEQVNVRIQAFVQNRETT